MVVSHNSKSFFNYHPLKDTYLEFKIPDHPKLKQENIRDFLKSYKDKLLFISSLYMYIFDKNTCKFDRIPLLGSVEKSTVEKMTHAELVGDSLWIFTKYDHLPKAYCYHLDRKYWVNYPIVYGNNTVKLNKNLDVGVTVSLVTKSWDYWLGIHSGGLAKYNPRLKYFEVIRVRQEVDFTKIGYTDFEEDREGNIWIATYDLVKFNPKTYDFQEVLDQDVIVSMLIDGRNTICMSTLDEVIFYNDKKRLKYTFAFESKNQFEIWGNKIYKLQNNKILATNKEIATLINYNDFKAHSFNDQLYIARIQAADSVILINENNLTVRLKTEQNSLSIGYGILMPPNTIMYDYYFQLEGFAQDWQLDKRQSRNAIYGNLDGGDYVFRVKARDVNGKFLPERRVYISIASPFYRAGWFRILSFVLAASLTIAFIVYRADQRKKIHHLQLQSTRLSKDKTEIQYQNLINHLNPHFLFNSLTSLNSLIIAEPKQASKFLQKLSAIYRYILQSKDKKTVTLEHELNFVKNYVELQKSRF